MMKIQKLAEKAEEILRKTEQFSRTSAGRKGLLWGMFLVCAAVFVFLTMKTPYVLDDYFALYKNPEGVPLFKMEFSAADRIRTFSDAAESQIHLFFNWSGRIFFLFTIQIVSIAPKLLFDILNGIAAGLCVWLTVLHAAGREKIHPVMGLGIISLFWLCCPAPGLTLLWMNGAVCYLWTAVFYLIFLYPFRMVLEYGPDSVKHIRLLSVIAFASGLIGCNANENTAGAVILFAVICLAAYRRMTREIPFWGVTGLAGALTGFCLLLFAPGLRVRVAAEGYAAPDIFHNFLEQTAHLLYTVQGLVPLCFVLFALLLTIRGKPVFREPAMRVLGLYGFTALAAAYAMVLSPYNPGRALFGSFILLLCFAGKIMTELMGRDRKITVMFSVSAAALLVMTVFSAAFAYRDISFTNSVQKARESYVRRMKPECQDFVFRNMAGISPYNALYKTDLLKSDVNAFVNRYYAHIWGVRSVRVTDEPDIVGMNAEIRVSGKQNPE